MEMATHSSILAWEIQWTEGAWRATVHGVAKSQTRLGKQIASPGWMHETSARGWCTGKTQRDGMEREVAGGDQDGEYM